LDLLQEIGKQVGRYFKAETDKALGKFSDLAYNATLGFLKQYQQRALELVRINVATFYAHILKIARKHVLLFCLLVFGTMVSAVALVIVPVAIILLTSWSTAVKIVCLLLLGSVYVAGTAWIFLVLFSEDRWMKLSGMQEMLDDIYSDESKF
jgi:hypothetical protein